MTQLNIEILKELGKFTRQLREEIYNIPKEGTKISEIIDFLEKKIFEKGYLPAFPSMVAVNDEAAHFTIFDEDYALKKGDLIKIDFGISHQGFCTDNAFTLEIGTNKYEKLMQANLEGLNAALETANLKTQMNQIGEAVDNVAQKYGFNTIHNLSGHQIAWNKLHHGLSVPNFKNNDTRQIEDNMELAIEPFFTTGEPKIKSAGNSNILHLISTKPIRDPIAKKVLDFIKLNFPCLPFSKRWLIKEEFEKLGLKNTCKGEGFDKRKVLYAINTLKKNNIIYEYDLLSTIDGAYVSQFEDSVCFINNEKTIITRLK